MGYKTVYYCDNCKEASDDPGFVKSVNLELIGSTMKTYDLCAPCYSMAQEALLKGFKSIVTIT